MKTKELVLLTGASGSMGFETFKLLWDRRDRFDLVLLLRPSGKNRNKFGSYLKEAGKADQAGKTDQARKAHQAGQASRDGKPAGGGLRIVWGDLLNRDDVAEACRGIDWCLHTAALISPAADRDPEMTELVNARGTRYLVEAIEAENPEHIKLVHVATVAAYGDRLPPIHVGRTGDPLVPSIFDYYAISKIRGELAVMQSAIKHRVSLRQTFIMIPGILSLKDPIMYHQPFNSFMENITARDSGRLMVSCLELPGDSAFWGGYYNISGGPDCRTTYLEFLDRIYSRLGIRLTKVMERNWFALKNFHMQFFGDSGRLNEYLHHWDGGQTLEDYFREVWEHLPVFLKATAWVARHLVPYRWLVEAATRRELRKLAYHREGTMGWIRDRDDGRIAAFYGSPEAFRRIPGWGEDMPLLDHSQEHRRLNHGYDESKTTLDLQDLIQAAEFRGGTLASPEWDGDLHASLAWKCCQEHAFSLTPHAVLKGGHWCQECIAPPWNYQLLAKKNPFAAQVLSPGR